MFLQITNSSTLQPPPRHTAPSSPSQKHHCDNSTPSPSNTWSATSSPLGIPNNHHCPTHRASIDHFGSRTFDFCILVRESYKGHHNHFLWQFGIPICFLTCTIHIDSEWRRWNTWHLKRSKQKVQTQVTLFEFRYVPFFCNLCNAGPGWHGAGWLKIRCVASSDAFYPTTRPNHINEDEKHRSQSVHESEVSMQIP